ncbi:MULTISPECIES: rhomboid family intramembrane serine protease [unclassified Pseudactinotalea]|uniref:rhomboid family intramembrane serine protease n=1 Tax=unclassified Pseudactinotalea TaxID=2649176 RepID=UPI003C7B4FD6
MRTRPYVTLTMIGLCVALFLLDFADGGAARRELIFSPLAGSVEPWRMLTTAFLHAGVLHLAVNMYALWITGPFLERFLGTWRFLALYLLAAFGGSVAVLVLTPYDLWRVGTVGASGAVFGLFAAAALLLRRVGGDYRQILLVIGINVVISFTIPNISWQAHMGGMIVGGLITVLYLYLPKKWRTTGAVLGAAAIAAALIGITVLAYALAGLWL